MAQKEGFVGRIDRVGKGDKRRPQQVPDQAVEENGKLAFGEDWAVPIVLRRKRVQQLELFDSPEGGG